jgi:hypothetical protein
MKYTLLIIFLLLSNLVKAQEKYNTIIGFPAGGGTDASFQSFANYISKSKNKIEFKPNYITGASGLIGMKAFFDSTDNKQLIWVGSGVSIGNSVLYKNPEYNIDNIKPIVLTQNTPLLIIKSPKSEKINDLSELFKTDCNKRVLISVSGLMHEIAGLIIKKTSTCDIALIMYKGDTDPLNDLLNGSIDLALIPYLSAEIVLQQEGKIIGTTANINDDKWNKYKSLSLFVNDANLYLEYGLWAKKTMSEQDYKKLISNIKTEWNNKEQRENNLKLKKGYYAKEIYGEGYHTFLKKTIIDLRKLAEKLDFQK